MILCEISARNFIVMLSSRRYIFFNARLIILTINFPLIKVGRFISIPQVTECCIRYQPMFMFLKKREKVFVLQEFFFLCQKNFFDYRGLKTNHLSILQFFQLVQLFLLFLQWLDKVFIIFSSNRFQI